MRFPRTDPNAAPAAAGFGPFWLRIRLHLDAAMRAPRGYLAATWWRIRGKRLRARARLGPLLGVSRLAYSAWLLSERALECADRAGPPIIALIDCRENGEGLPATLRSLAVENVQWVTIGTTEQRDQLAAVRALSPNDRLWVMPLAAGDLLAPGAGAAYRLALADVAGARIVYADDDLLDAAGRRCAPHFKPDWNNELFRHFDYLTGACIIHVSPDMLTWPSDTAHTADMVRAVANDDGPTPVHLTHILHHRRTRPAPRRPMAETRAAKSFDLPSISVIIPTRNRVDLLHTCLTGLAQTDYPDIRTIIVDNESDDSDTLRYLAALDSERHQVLRQPGPFNFSALCNKGAGVGTSPLLCLLNNDIEIVSPDWLAIMARQAMRSDVGAVGAQLLYPDGRIQHAGVVIGVGGGAAHAHRMLRPEDQGYFHRHALPQFVSAVTAACLVVQRARFEAVGGLNERDFAVAFNDVDLCLRLNAQGWQSLYEPRARLIHHESVSRGFDRDPVGAARLAGELQALKAAWGTDTVLDPFRHPELDPSSEHFVLRLQA